jgi:hypothetical protein
MDLAGDGSHEFWIENSYVEGGTSMVVNCREGA